MSSAPGLAELAASRPQNWPMSSVLPPLAPFPSVPGICRSHVNDVLGAWRIGELAELGTLIASELATNAVRASIAPDGNPRYIGGWMPVVQLRLFSDGTALLIAVHDLAPGSPRRLDADTDAEGGRGLALVDTLTGGRWGWHPTGATLGKVVWALLGA